MASPPTYGSGGERSDDGSDKKRKKNENTQINESRDRFLVHI
jgi:hypothetical protein